MNIITVPDPRLRKASTKVNHITDETHQIIKEMVDASLEWEKQHPHELSAAMAAPLRVGPTQARYQQTYHYYS